MLLVGHINLQLSLINIERMDPKGFFLIGIRRRRRHKSFLAALLRGRRNLTLAGFLVKRYFRVSLDLLPAPDIPGLTNNSRIIQQRVFLKIPSVLPLRDKRFRMKKAYLIFRQFFFLKFLFGLRFLLPTVFFIKYISRARRTTSRMRHFLPIWFFLKNNPVRVFYASLFRTGDNAATAEAFVDHEEGL